MEILPAKTMLPRDQILAIANKHSTAAVQSSRYGDIGFFITAIEEALTAYDTYQSEQIREYVRSLEPGGTPIPNVHGHDRGYSKQSRTDFVKTMTPVRRGPVCSRCGERGPHVCKMLHQPDSK
jgi:hypothetical protein